MNLTGNITTTLAATGTASVAAATYSNEAGTITARFKITPAAGAPVVFQQTISGADVVALGAAWSDTDLLNWLAKKFDLTTS